MQMKTMRETLGDKVMLDKVVTTNGTKGSNKAGPHPEKDGHKICQIVEVLVKSEMTEETMIEQIIEMAVIDTNKT
jgi:hypothetical protein